MAILIPSKNIYDINNPKIRDNVADNVSVEQTNVLPDNRYETPVSNNKYVGNFDVEPKIPKSEFDYTNISTIGGNAYYTVSIAYASATPIYKTVVVDIPILQQNNSYISELKLGADKEGNANIKYLLYGSVEKGTAKATAVSGYISGGTDYIKEDTIQETPYEEQENSGIINPPNTTIEYSQEGGPDSLHQAKAVVEFEVPNNSNIANIEKADIITIDKADYYRLTITVLCCIDIQKMGIEGADYIYPSFGSAWEYEITGTYERYHPEQLEITVYGNTIGIDLTDGTATYGSGNRPFKIGGNELLQDGATTNDVLTTQYLANNIINQYENGKETATLLCSIDEYYDEDGKKVISTKTADKMTFELQDEVIPTVKNEYGVEEPMSLYPYGLHKKFSVIGKEFIYDGALWQKLYLEEIQSSTKELRYQYSYEYDGWVVVGFGKQAIEDVVIPKYFLNYPVKVIGEKAFYFSTIKSIVIPETIVKIEKSAVRGCSLLRQIVINANLKDFSKPNEFVFASAGNLTNNTEVFFGKNVSRIPANLFNSNNGSNYPRINEVIFENNSVCQSIGRYAFYGCAKLKTIIFPKTLKSIEQGAFYDCSALTKILSECTTMEEFNAIDIAEDNEPLNNASVYLYSETEPSSLGYWRYNQNGEPVIWFESEDLSSTEGVVFSDNGDGTCSVTSYTGTEADVVIRRYANGKLVTKIADDAFYDNDYIHSIKMPESVVTIGVRAFHLCQNLSNIDFGESPSLTTIGDIAFRKCTSLVNVEIPDTVTTIGKNAYQLCTNVETLTIGKNVKSIGEFAFGSLENLREIKFNSIDMDDVFDKYLFADLGTPYEITLTIGKSTREIPDGLFRNATQIFNLIFEDNGVCEKIGDSAFYGCTSLTNVIIPDSVTSIGSNAFISCKNLINVVIGNGVTSIFDSFKYCTSLYEVTFGNNVKEIGIDSFQNCTALRIVRIPASATYISAYAFPSTVTDVYFGGTSAQWSALTSHSDHCLRNATVHYV